MYLQTNYINFLLHSYNKNDDITYLIEIRIKENRKKNNGTCDLKNN